ncbi:MAG: hypothetical protein HQL80_02980 [Magnetococcales bacterium]|nr:hypothetical protein [Magnetococcales bacterium]
MTTCPDNWREGDLCFDFSSAETVIKLDDSAHGLSHLLKAVDFVVEWPDQFWLIEVKDPEHSAIPTEHQPNQKQCFADILQSGRLIAEHLFPKFRDSLLYLGMDRGIPAKPMRYLVLICLSSLDPTQLHGLAESLFRTQWLSGPKDDWSKHFSVMALNLAQWNRALPHCSVTRSGITAATSTSAQGDG